MFYRQLPTPEEDRVTNFRNTSENFKKLRDVLAKLAEKNVLDKDESGMLVDLESQTTFSELLAACKGYSIFESRYVQAAAKPIFFLSSYIDSRMNIDYYLLNFTQELEGHIAKYDLGVEVTNTASGLGF